jgi:hypothetical protein
MLDLQRLGAGVSSNCKPLLPLSEVAVPALTDIANFAPVVPTMSAVA